MCCERRLKRAKLFPQKLHLSGHCASSVPPRDSRVEFLHSCVTSKLDGECLVKFRLRSQLSTFDFDVLVHNVSHINRFYRLQITAILMLMLLFLMKKKKKNSPVNKLNTLEENCVFNFHFVLKDHSSLKACLKARQWR